MPSAAKSESPIPPRRGPSRRLTRDAVIFVAAVSLAGAAWFFRPAFQRHRMAAADTEDPMAIGPDWHKPAHPWSQVESAQIGKRNGLKACEEEKWQECWHLLRESQADDPRLETDPEIVAAMQRVVEESKEESRKYQEEHPGM
jgi:hypothetical protein